MAKEFPSNKEIETYNEVAAYLNEQSQSAASTLDAGFEDEDLTNRIPCIRIVAGVTEKYNCKTGERIP